MAEKHTKTPMDFKVLTMWERDYKTLFTKKFLNRKKYEVPNHKMALSYIPGLIQRLIIKEGQKVVKGEPMLILESMKMLNIVLVPIDGKVKKIHVKVGEKVAKNYLMVEFE
jgi:biotin carboxyl carrier protein